MKRIELISGKTLEIILAEAVASGYLWSHMADDDLEVLKEYERRDPNDTNVGSPAKITFHVKSDKAGIYKLVLIHVRPWNGETIDVLEYILDIK
jgi:predicted secreted protein